jgi:hypothetical protein
MRFFLLFCFGLLFSGKALGQSSDNSIEDIKAYVDRIDSLTDIKTFLASDKAELILTISEGQIKNKKRGLKGGFSNEEITNPDMDTLYLFRRHDNLEKNLYESYYYRSDKLVFSKIELRGDDDTNTILFLKQVYYKDDKIIGSTIDQDKLNKKYEWRINFDPLTNGYQYLKDFKSKMGIK